MKKVVIYGSMIVFLIAMFVGVAFAQDRVTQYGDQRFAARLLVEDSVKTLDRFYYWDGAAWVEAGSDAGLWEFEGGTLNPKAIVEDYVFEVNTLNINMTSAGNTTVTAPVLYASNDMSASHVDARDSFSLKMDTFKIGSVAPPAWGGQTVQGMVWDPSINDVTEPSGFFRQIIDGYEYMRIAAPSANDGHLLDFTIGRDKIDFYAGSGTNNVFNRVTLDSMGMFLGSSKPLETTWIYQLSSQGVTDIRAKNKIRITATDSVTVRADVVKVTDTLSARVIDKSYGEMGFRDSSYTVALDIDVPSWVTNSGNDLWQQSATTMRGVTYAGDSLVVNRSGVYYLSGHLSVGGSNNDVLRAYVYRNGTPLCNCSPVTSLVNNRIVNLQLNTDVAVLVSGDVLKIYVENIGTSNDVAAISGKITIHRID